MSVVEESQTNVETHPTLDEQGVVEAPAQNLEEIQKSAAEIPLPTNENEQALLVQVEVHAEDIQLADVEKSIENLNSHESLTPESNGSSSLTLVDKGKNNKILQTSCSLLF